ncbi:MAG: hypothetical protein IPO81_06240 [Kouleothrix sp.]|nr:hypothetical protein [Kouleothrix sp.]
MPTKYHRAASPVFFIPHLGSFADDWRAHVQQKIRPIGLPPAEEARVLGGNSLRPIEAVCIPKHAATVPH